MRLFGGNKPVQTSKYPAYSIPKQGPIPELIQKDIREITLNDWITSSGRYPERASSPELTDEVKTNATGLLADVNMMLNELGWEGKRDVSSGFRPSAVNSKVKGAAKKSAHQTGLAVDISQPKKDNKLGKLIRERQAKDSILARHGLMMEALEATIGVNTAWVHLDKVNRADRPSREFKP